MGKSKSYSRRQFLKNSSWASAGLLLSGCMNFRAAFSGDKRNLNDEVVILGAGAAGLAAAYTLKKNKIPYRLFEASSRVGGRIYTLQNFTAGGLHAELGGEFFRDTHRRIFQLGKELNLGSHEVPLEKHREALVLEEGKIWTQANFLRQMRPLFAELTRLSNELFFRREVLLTADNIGQYEKALYYDALSAEDFIHGLRLRMDVLPLNLFLLQVRHRFGVEPSQLSALQLMSEINRDPSLGLGEHNRRFRLVGGSGALTRTLYERVAGVIPDYLVKVNHALNAIAPLTDGFELEFRTPSGRQSFRTKQIICTLPFSTLRDVDGWRRLDFSPRKRELIQAQAYSSQTKAVLEFQTAFWKQKTKEHPAYDGRLLGDFPSQNFWDAGLGQEGEGALLATRRGGRSAATLEAGILRQALEDLEKIHPGAAELATENQNYMNWGERAWQKGGASFFAPEQYHKFSGVAAKPEYGGRFLFAGEHTSVEFSGTMEGAFASGVAAAEMLGAKAI